MKIFIHDPDNWASGYYRAKLPFYQCYSSLYSEGIQLTLDSELTSVETYYDAYMFHRQPPDGFLMFLKEVKEKHNKKLIWNLDDNLWETPENYPVSFDKNKLDFCLNLADYVWVSTSKLAEYINSPKVRIAPLLADENCYYKHNKKHDFVNILWCGSVFHTDDLDLIVNPLLNIKKDFKDRVNIALWGCTPDKLKDVATCLKGMGFRYYFKELSKLSPDIGLAPLKNNKFNICKSELKFIDYYLSGAVVVSSDIGVYNQGLLVENNDSSWYNAIAYLLDDNNRLKEYEKSVIKEHCWKFSKEIWLKLFREIAN